jgi:purine nucleosidase
VARPVVIDTDGGVDDAVALWSALTDPGLDVVAITVVWGNVDVDVATASVLRVAHAAGRGDVPVAVGARGPLPPAPDLRPATFIHGDDGLGNAAGPPAPHHAVEEPAPEMLVRLAHERPGELTLVTLGPLTNIGVAIGDDPRFAANIADCFVMGGSARRTSSTTRLARSEPSLRRGPDHRC